MDVSAKDSARSKYRLTQKRSRGRGSGPAGRASGGAGRGGAGGAGGGRPRQSARRSQDASKLGNNHDRFQEEEEGQAGDGDVQALGPTARKSKGADLAELLANADCLDPGRQWRFRALQAELEFEASKHVATSQEGLSLDLKSLDACLGLLPLHEVLDIQPEYVYADDSIEDTRTELERAGGAVAQGTLETMLPVEEVTGAQTAASQPVATAAAPSVSAPPAAQRTQPPPGPHLASVPAESVQQANPQPKLAAPDEAELDTLLAGGKLPAADSMPAVAAPSDPAGSLPDELDALLSLSTSKQGGAAAGMASTASASAGPAEGQSIEDWLDSL